MTGIPLWWERVHNVFSVFHHPDTHTWQFVFFIVGDDMGVWSYGHTGNTCLFPYLDMPYATIFILFFYFLWKYAMELDCHLHFALVLCNWDILFHSFIFLFLFLFFFSFFLFLAYLNFFFNKYFLMPNDIITKKKC